MKIHNVTQKYSGKPPWKTHNQPRKIGCDLYREERKRYEAWKAHYFPNHTHSGLVKEMLAFYMETLYPMESPHEAAESDELSNGGTEAAASSGTQQGV